VRLGIAAGDGAGTRLAAVHFSSPLQPFRSIQIVTLVGRSRLPPVIGRPKS
jgi:hypothetical protein